MEHSAWFTVETGMVVRVVIRDCIRYIFVPLFHLFARCHFREILIVEWALPGPRLFLACCVVTCFDFIPSISTSSCIAWETKTLPLSDIMTAGK